MPVKKAVIVAAGYGTRFLPITKTIPKEMLPLVDRPSIDYIVEELCDAGIEDILVITSRRKKVLDDWFDREIELETTFVREGRDDKRAKLAQRPARVHFVRQQEMKGTGHALALARTFAGSDPFVVAYPDDLFGAPNCTRQLIETYEATGCTVLSAKDLAGQDVSRYGVLDIEEDGGQLRVRAMVEKPPVGEEPSTLVSMGRYLYTPDLFPRLEAGLARHGDGEYFQTEPINELAAAGRVVARVVDAPRYDTGAPLGYLQTMVELALQRDDVGPALRAWLEARLAQ